MRRCRKRRAPVDASRGFPAVKSGTDLVNSNVNGLSLPGGQTVFAIFASGENIKSANLKRLCLIVGAVKKTKKKTKKVSRAK